MDFSARSLIILAVSADVSVSRLCAHWAFGGGGPRWPYGKDNEAE